MELTCLLPDREVYLNGKVLDPKPSQNRHNHSPDGFMWGYEGSGPAQLALAVMIEMLKGTPNEDRIRDYQNFKRDVIAKLPMDKSIALEMDFMGWLSGEKDYRFEMEELTGPLASPEVNALAGECTPGYGDRCANGSSDSCACRCGGKNHGSAHQVGFTN